MSNGIKELVDRTLAKDRDHRRDVRYTEDLFQTAKDYKVSIAAVVSDDIDEIITHELGNRITMVY